MDKLKKVGLAGALAFGFMAGASVIDADEEEEAYPACESWYYEWDC
ncbi:MULTISPECIES: hypothetical protein [Pontibacillus]|uniref:Porin n=1 Tax=Pontibacillus chungwhensis TaxID=265426 RepID=A0ABY8V0C7_9BACI|nr:MULTISPECIES: hypothetical protein [Pontibacillus]MCD5324475.1 hypothetical protein [Pontibacillus sp. HN14]WIF99232.1 hypothetical protein QNI29_06110 [Pontibacillus chungwhensis]